MSNYLVLLSLFSMPLACMHDERLKLDRFDSIIDDEIDTHLAMHQEHTQAKQALLLMIQEDQGLRRQALRTGHLYNNAQATELNKKHVAILKNIIRQFGWPSQETFNEDCSFAAWLIAQHANHDLDFQKQARNNVSYLDERFAPIYWVFLTDRILANENKPQLYGTQYAQDGILWPINDPDNLDKRRKAMQLSPMEKYQDIMAVKFLQLKCASPALPSE